MRGQGLTIDPQFYWTQQEDGNYTIFSVPIYRECEDATREDLEEAVKNFNEGKNQSKPDYPRIHISHHNHGELVRLDKAIIHRVDTTNLEPCGYMDFFELREEEGILYMYADFIEVPENIFEDIWNDKYPKRSVEYDLKEKKIKSIALLSSRSPYFSDLGILNRKTMFQEPVELEQAALANFQKRSTYLKGATAMGWLNLKKYSEDESFPDKENYEDGEENTENMQDDGEDTENNEEGAEPSMEEKFMQFMESCEKRFSDIEAKLGGGGGEEEKPLGLEPSTGAYQKQMALFQKEIMKEIKGISTKVYQLEQSKVDDKITQEIRTLSRINGESFENIHARVKAYQGRENKLAYLKEKINDAKAEKNYFASGHPAQVIANNISVPVDEIEKKYQGESPKIKRLIPMMIEDFQENAHLSSVKLYGGLDNWIEHHVKEEKRSPGYYESEIRA